MTNYHDALLRGMPVRTDPLELGRNSLRQCSMADCCVATVGSASGLRQLRSIVVFASSLLFACGLGLASPADSERVTESGEQGSSVSAAPVARGKEHHPVRAEQGAGESSLSDRDLLAALLRGVTRTREGGAFPAGWVGPIKVRVMGCVGNSPSDAQLHATVRRSINDLSRLTGLQFSIVTENSASLRFVEAGEIRLNLCSLGPTLNTSRALPAHYGFQFATPSVQYLEYEFGTDAKTRELKTEKYSGRRIVRAGIAGFEVEGGRIVRGQCLVNYHYKRQYLHFDLSADILKRAGKFDKLPSLLPDLFAPTRSMAETNIPPINIYDSAVPPHKSVLRDLVEEQRISLQEKCLRADFERRRRDIVDQCLSEVLGYSWGGSLNSDEERRIFRGDRLARERFLERGLLTERHFESSDRQLALRHWKLFLKVIYLARSQQAVDTPEAKLAALLSAERPAFDRKTKVRPNCTSLP